MNKANQDRIPWDEVKSPKGKYHLFRRHISLAMGGKKDVGEWGGGHPFDLEMTRIPPDKTNWPYHAHASQWELYVILSGRGVARTPEGDLEIGTGDCLILPPGEPHQMRNHGTEDLVYYVIANNSRSDVSNYPDSGKLFIKPQRKSVTLADVNYYQDEE